MDNLFFRIEADLITAAKNRDKSSLLALRAVKNTLHNLKIQRLNQTGELVDSEVIKVLRSEIKKRQEAAELYNQGGRSELAQTEKEEMAVLTKYLPKAPTIEEVKMTVNKLKTELGATTVKDMGRLTKAVMESFGGAADGKQISTLVKEVLTS